MVITDIFITAQNWNCSVCLSVGKWLHKPWHVHTVAWDTAAAAAKPLQSCPALCGPRDGSPPGSPVPGVLQARTLEWVAISFSNAWEWKVKVKSLSRVWLFATPWTAAHQAPPSMGFSRQEDWSGEPYYSTIKGNKVLTLTHAAILLNPQGITWTEESQPEKLHAVWFHLYNTLDVIKLEMEMSGCQVLGTGVWGRRRAWVPPSTGAL